MKDVIKSLRLQIVEMSTEIFSITEQLNADIIEDEREKDFLIKRKIEFAEKKRNFMKAVDIIEEYVQAGIE